MARTAPTAPTERLRAEPGTVRLSVVLGQWLDRSIEADLQLAMWADELGYGQLWVPEMAKVDAPAFAAIVAGRTDRIELVLGPLAVTVRSPVQIALAATTVAASGRATHIALGTSSTLVARWHGRSRAGAAERLGQTRVDVVTLLDGGRVNGYRLPHLAEHRPTVTVAAFGPRAVETARAADRMVLNMVTVASASGLASRHPNTAVWLCAAVDPTEDERLWLSRGLVGYLAAPGYGEMFSEAGYGELVEFARTRPGPKEVFARMPHDLIDQVGLVGSESEIRDRIAAYASAGIAEVCVVPPAPDLPSARRTLEVLAPLGRD